MRNVLETIDDAVAPTSIISQYILYHHLPDLLEHDHTNMYTRKCYLYSDRMLLWGLNLNQP